MSVVGNYPASVDLAVYLRPATVCLSRLASGFTQPRESLGSVDT